MRAASFFSLKFYPFLLVFFALLTSFMVVPDEFYQNTGTIALNSYSFNAKKRSGFSVVGQKETVQRGLTIIHFNSSSTYEFRTFDTYANSAEIDSLLKVLQLMKANGSKFAVLAHDSATKEVFGHETLLSKLGFSTLSQLKGRQAYVAHNLGESMVERTDDQSVFVSIPVTNEFKDEAIYFPKETYEFEPRVDRYIAHAGGEIDGHAYTNTQNALDESYQKGFRMFELDIAQTSDGHYVAAHDWKMWSRFTEYGGSLPPTLETFKKHTIYGDYKTMDMSAINSWFKAHPDAMLVTDKITDPLHFASKFIDKERLIMELFSPMAIEEASNNGIQAMISQEPLMRLKGDKINYLKVNNVKYVALSRRIIDSEKKLLLQLRDNGIKVYVYNVNFDPGKDERYVYENELGLVYGMYADKWMFDETSTTPSK